MRPYLLAAVLAAASLPALAEETLEERMARLEKALAEERARGEAREERIRELETALDKTTEAFAQAQDRRALLREIEDFLADRSAIPSREPANRLSIGAVIVVSYRATRFVDGPARTNTFQVEERYLRFVYRFSEELTARYYTDGSLAEVEYHPSDLFQVNAGVVVVPFGQFNARSFPDTFDTLSRPLLYLGDEDTFATPANNPRPVFRSIYSDTGVVLSGNWWRGGRQLYYAAHVTNGLVGVNELGQDSSFADNNDSKQFGARVAYAVAEILPRVRAGFGLSFLAGKYDSADSHSYRMYGADVVVVIDGIFRRGEGSLTFRGEWVYAPREVRFGTVGDPSALVNDVNRVQGGYLLAEARIDARWMVYVEGDLLSQEQPLLAGGLFDPLDPAEVRSRLLRVTAGIVHRFPIGIVWKLEYGFWDFDHGAPDAHRLSTQVVVPF